jgi:hypothetical protein
MFRSMRCAERESQSEWATMRRTVLTVVSLASATLAAVAVPAASAGAASSSQAVTATTIRVGMPYPDLAPVRKLGVNLNQGNWDDAYKALVANINAHGGINGRKIVPYVVAVNPIGTAPNATACTQLTEDDQIFVALAPVEPQCYNQAGVPTINGTFTAAASAGEAPNFSITPPGSAYDPIQLAVFAKKGVFKGKKVAIIGATADQAEMMVVRSTLEKLHVDVAEYAIGTAPPTDQVAEDAQINSFVQRMQSAGVNEVVAVGSEGAWAQGLNEVSSTFHSPWIATSESTLATIVSGSTTIPAKYMNVLTSSSILPDYAIWKDPAIQSCVSIVRKAYPHDSFTVPTPASTGANSTFTSVVGACENLGLFAAIAKAAGKDLTEKSFVKAGYGLKNAIVPGSPAAISFGAGQPYALGPVYIATYDAKTKTLNYATTSSAG